MEKAITADLPPTYVEGFHDKSLCQRMQYNPLGNTDMRVSRISFGGAALSEVYGAFDENEAFDTLHQALRSGINYIDTAPSYGQSEHNLGSLLREVPRSAYYIATKVGRYPAAKGFDYDYSAERTHQSVLMSLRSMHLDYIDVVQIHDIEFAENLDQILEECLPMLEQLVREGKVRHIGLSAYPLDILKECIERAPGRFQLVLSYARNTLLDNALQEYLPFFRTQRLGVVCASGQAMGLLTNAGPPAWHPAPDSMRKVCREAASACAAVNVELGKLAMHHFIRMSGPDTFLTGMRNRTQLDMNMAAFHEGLSEREATVLQRIKETFFTRTDWHWEGIELQRRRDKRKEGVL